VLGVSELLADAAMTERNEPSYGAAPPLPGRGQGFSGVDPVTAILERQAASGMWEEPGEDAIEVTTRALVALVRLGVSSSHPIHGAQTKKAVGALLAAIAAAPALAPKLAEVALGALWLLSTGRRTRTAIRDLVGARRGLEALSALLGHDDDDDVRAHVERIAPV
jgi:Ca-activated chloride channel family protein